MTISRPTTRSVTRYLAAGAFVITVVACDDADEPASAPEPTGSPTSQPASTVDVAPNEPAAPSTTTTTASTTTASTTPASTTTAPTTPGGDIAETEAAELAAQQFMEARSNHDAEPLIALMAPGATFGGSELAQRVDDYTLQTQYEEIVDWQFRDVSCSAGSPERVVCSYTLQDAFNEHAGQGPYPGSSFLLELDGDQIIRATHNVDAPDEFFSATEVGFFAWIREHSPEDLEAMVGDRPFGIAPVNLTAESIELWAEHVNAFLATTD